MEQKAVNTFDNGNPAYWTQFEKECDTYLSRWTTNLRAGEDAEFLWRQ